MLGQYSRPRWVGFNFGCDTSCSLQQREGQLLPEHNLGSDSGNLSVGGCYGDRAHRTVVWPSALESAFHPHFQNWERAVSI